MKEVKLRFIPTGNIFNLPYEEAERLYKEDDKNFEFIDEEFKQKVQSKLPTTTFNKVVVNEVKPIANYSYNELKAYCKENGLKQSGNTEELRERALEHNRLVCLCDKLTKLTGKTVAEGTTVEEVEKEIIDALMEKVTEAGIEVEQNPVTIDYLEDLLQNPREIKE